MVLIFKQSLLLAKSIDKTYIGIYLIALFPPGTLHYFFCGSSWTTSSAAYLDTWLEPVGRSPEAAFQWDTPNSVKVTKERLRENLLFGDTHSVVGNTTAHIAVSLLCNEITSENFLLKLSAKNGVLFPEERICFPFITCESSLTEDRDSHLFLAARKCKAKCKDH